MIHEDEASFRLEATLHQTWARVGQQPLVPVTGQRQCLKVIGAVEVFSARFAYEFVDVFNAETYRTYLERLARRWYPHKTYLIQDNASYHKERDLWAWFRENRAWLTVTQLPPYSPELNAAERLWHYTRMESTHNHYFATFGELTASVTKTFTGIQRRPQRVCGYLAPFA